MKYRKITEVEASQWFKIGDHPAVAPIYGAGTAICSVCNAPSNAHGLCKTLEGRLGVCVGDWILTSAHGENYPCKPDIFAATYEPAEHDAREAVIEAAKDALTEYARVTKDHEADGAMGALQKAVANLEGKS